GSADTPAFVPRTGSANPLIAAFVPGWSTPALGDVDGDGDLDLVTGDQLGLFSYFENTGTARVPLFASRTGVANPLAGQFVTSRSAPALGDLDRDGELELVSGNQEATFQTFVLPEPGSRGLLGAGLAWLGWLAGIGQLGDLGRRSGLRGLGARSTRRPPMTPGPMPTGPEPEAERHR
ncbi:FG-GAP-like repeat-containing protein, partial [Myxococcota bacterium]|nr:FG-GAP-like repeat-containing protein [Myxococcota bacterium]